MNSFQNEQRKCVNNQKIKPCSLVLFQIFLVDIQSLEKNPSRTFWVKDHEWQKLESSLEFKSLNF